MLVSERIESRLGRIAVWAGAVVLSLGIGLSRTGTTSLAMALEILGIRTKHYPHDKEIQTELFGGDGHLTVLRRYQAITDISVVPFFRQLDAAYPDSRFILTTRDEDAWVGSLRRHLDDLGKHWDQSRLTVRVMLRLGALD